jgi:carbon starvation protein
MSFVLVMAFFAGVIKLGEYYQQCNWLRVILDVVVLVISVLVMLEECSVIAKHRRDNALKSSD